MSFAERTSKVHRVGLVCALVFCVIAIGIPHFTPSLNHPVSPPLIKEPITIVAPQVDSKFEIKEELPEKTVTTGQRAVALKLNYRQSVEGFAREGTFVDVVWTHVSRGGELKSEVIASRAKVFAAKQEGNSNVDQDKILLEVSPEESLKLITIRDIAEISFILRDPKEGLTDLKVVTASLMSDEENKGYCPSSLGSTVPVGTKAFSGNIKTPMAVGFFSECYGRGSYHQTMPQMN